MTRTILATLALLATAHSAQAQLRTQLAPETRVRVIVPGFKVTERTAATVIAAGADSVILQISGSQRTFAYTDIPRLEVSRGTRRIPSMIWGAAVGVGAGLLAAEVDRRSHLHAGEENTPAPPYSARRRVVLMFSGAVAGFGFGALIPADRWARVPMP
ncbi:MAG TPA: hypothetical protein VF613_13175 [Longimicrobium sp.]|jgi:hypothetical protein